MPLGNKWALLAAAVLAAGAAHAQEAVAFAGAWRGEHAGKTYLLISIEPGASWKIAFTTAHIQIGETGEIDEIDGPVELDEKVLESKLERGMLYIKTEQGDGSVMEYRMTVEDGGKTALLRIVGAPAIVKPFRLRRG
jgi:hypothetical protein